jgi:hypothetical protein
MSAIVKADVVRVWRPFRGIAHLLARSGRAGGPSRHGLKLHAAASVVIAIVLSGVWATTTRAYFWPMHVLLPLALALALHGWLVLVVGQQRVSKRVGSTRVAAHAGAAAALWLYLAGIWLQGGGAYFWPGWVLIGLAALVGIHALEEAGRRARLLEGPPGEPGGGQQ